MIKVKRAIFYIDFYDPQDLDAPTLTSGQDALDAVYKALDDLMDNKVIEDFSCSKFEEES